MTGAQAIEMADDFRAGNAVPYELKLSWMNDIEHTIYNDVIRTHCHDLFRSQWWTWDEETHRLVFKPCPEYTEDNTDSVLIAEKPYDMLYVFYIMAMIDLYSQEMVNYNSAVALHNEKLQAYKNKYHETHTPVPNPRIKVGVFR